MGPSILSNGYPGLFRGCTVASDHLTPSDAEVKDGGAIPLLPHKFSWADA
jgi:hypothetical protein